MAFSNNYVTNFKFLCIGLIGILFLTQCASSNFTGTESTYSMTLGDIEARNFQGLVDRLQNRYQYEIERNDTYGSNEVFLRTYWKKHPPFTSDPTFESDEVETRIILRTRSKNSQGYKIYSAEFKGEFRALLPTENGGEEFQRIALTDEAEEYFDDIATDLQDRVRGTLRGRF